MNLKQEALIGLGVVGMVAVGAWMLTRPAAAPVESPNPDVPDSSVKPNEPKPQKENSGTVNDLMREMARRGGQKSAEVRRAKKLAREAAKAAASGGV